MHEKSLKGRLRDDWTLIHGSQLTLLETTHASSPRACRSEGVQIQTSMSALDAACIRHDGLGLEQVVPLLESIKQTNEQEQERRVVS